MIKTFRVLVALLALPLAAAASVVPSGVYHWGDSVPSSCPGGEVRTILNGETPDMADLSVLGYTLAPDAAREHAGSKGAEQLLIVRSGTVEVSIGEKKKTMEANGVAYAFEGESLNLSAAGDAPVSYYLFRYEAKLPGQPERGVKAGGSFLLPWAQVHFAPSATGGYREQYRAPTTLFDTFEMHTTTMNPGLQNHPVHTHSAAEFVLMISGDVQMQLDGDTVFAKGGDLMYLGGNVPHGILKNLGSEPTEYFAFQWWQ